MLVSTDIINKIDEIVERSYLDFTFLIIGDDFFTDEQKRSVEALGLIIGRRPLIELLYMLVRMRTNPRYRKDKTLTELLDEVAQTGVLPTIDDTQRYTVDHGKAAINEAIDNTKAFITKKVKQEVLNTNLEFKNEIQTEGITNIPALQEKADKSMLALGAAIAGIALASNSEFRRAFTTSLTDFINGGVVDELKTLHGTQLPETKVYKQVVNDASLCRWCQAFYIDIDGAPKIYLLKELIKNGTNDGKPRSAWKPVVGATHPRCRCQLVQVVEE